MDKKIIRVVAEDWTGKVLKEFTGEDCEDNAIEWWDNHEDQEDLFLVGYNEAGDRLGINFG